MKNAVIYIFLTSMSFLTFSCSCVEEQEVNPVDFPNPFFVTDFDRDDQEIYITFNRSVDTETVEAMSSLILTPPAPLAGDDYYQVEAWDLNNTLLIIEFGVFEACSDILQNGDDCPVEFRLISDKDATLSVRSVDGQLLDGNRDGSDGDDFVFEFSVQ